MPILAYTLAVTATAQSLDQALPTDKTPGGTQDFGFRELILSADTNPCYIGSDNTVSTTKFGVEIFAAAAGVQPIYLGPFDSGPIKLSTLWVIGTSGNLHILGIPF